jgi:arylsulfatase A-like enzyme
MLADRPDILFIMTDQQRFDTIAALGNSHIYTPNLDRLVRRGNQLFKGVRYVSGLHCRSLHDPHRMRADDDVRFQ